MFDLTLICCVDQWLMQGMGLILVFLILKWCSLDIKIRRKILKRNAIYNLPVIFIPVCFMVSATHILYQHIGYGVFLYIA